MSTLPGILANLVEKIEDERPMSQDGRIKECRFKFLFLIQCHLNSTGKCLDLFLVLLLIKRGVQLLAKDWVYILLHSCLIWKVFETI